jgi:soluble lytic murein transglycosylase-like protein
VDADLLPPFNLNLRPRPTYLPMPRTRATPNPRAQRTTASPSQGSGCSSGLFLPPLAVLLVSGLLAAFANSRFAQASSPSESYPGYAQGTSFSLSTIFTPTIQYWKESLLAWSAEFGLDPNLAATVMQIESCGDPRAVSSARAMGLFQVMPFHFYTTDDPYHPETNARRGLGYLVRALERAGGDARLALAGYNGGIGLIGRAEWTWPAETKRYVFFGGPIYEDARAGLPSSDRLNEWFNKYGASLCRQASERLGLP